MSKIYMFKPRARNVAETVTGKRASEKLSYDLYANLREGKYGWITGHDYSRPDKIGIEEKRVNREIAVKYEE